MRGAPSELTAPTRRHMITVAQILDPETSQLFIDIEGDALTGGLDFLQSSVQQECFRADSALGAVAPNGSGGTVRCSGTLAPVCMFQAVMLIASDGWGFNCVNGAAQARNWLVQVWGPRAFCRGGLGEQAGISRALLDGL